MREQPSHGSICHRWCEVAFREQSGAAESLTVVVAVAVDHSHAHAPKQCVDLTGRSTTGPPCSVTVELYLDWRRRDVIAWPVRVKPPAGQLWSVTDAYRRRRQTPASVASLAPYIMCRPASNNVTNLTS